MTLLGSLGVEAVADVRRFPASRFNHFKRDELSKLLEGRGLSYIYLGQELGGYRSQGYQAYVQTEDFREGLEKLEELARERIVVILCCERLPWRCHRRFIGRELERDGFQVEHVIDEKRRWVPRYSEEG